MIGALIGAGVSAASSIAGGIKARKAIKKQRGIIDSQMRENDNWFNAEYYKDALDNAESRSYLKTLSDRLYKKDKAIENGAISTGATHENALASKQAANEVMSNAVNDIVAQQSAKKEDVRREYLATKRGIQNQQGALEQQKANNWIDMAGNIGQAAMAAGNVFSGAGGSLFGGKSGPVLNKAGLDNVTAMSRGRI